jgi:hypothetical protein
VPPGRGVKSVRRPLCRLRAGRDAHYPPSRPHLPVEVNNRRSPRSLSVRFTTDFQTARFKALGLMRSRVPAIGDVAGTSITDAG